MNNYEQKYYKYKKKYIELQKQLGGSITKYMNMTPNIKPIMNPLKTENSLDEKYPSRAIRDQSTDAIVNVLFKYDYDKNDTENKIRTYKRNFFLMFINDYFNLYIKSEFETNLMDYAGVDILNHDENIEFIFKGGNIYFETMVNHYEKLIHCLDSQPDDLSDKLQNKIFLYKKLFIDYCDNFKVSDFDFAIVLKCNNHIKYNKINNILIKFTTIKLEELTDYFNVYLANILKDSELLSNGITGPTGISNDTEYYLDTPPRRTGLTSSTGATGATTSDMTSIDSYKDNFYKKRSCYIKKHTDNINHVDNIECINLVNKISSYFSELYNNQLFPIFTFHWNTDHAKVDDIINDKHIQRNKKKYKTIIKLSRDKIIEIINIMTGHVNNINYCIEQFNQKCTESQLYKDKNYDAKLIDVISKLDYINREKHNKYGSYLFKAIPLDILCKLKKEQKVYLDELKDHLKDIQFYSGKIFKDILQNIHRSLNDMIKCPDKEPRQPIRSSSHMQVVKIPRRKQQKEQKEQNIIQKLYNQREHRITIDPITLDAFNNLVKDESTELARMTPVNPDTISSTHSIPILYLDKALYNRKFVEKINEETRNLVFNTIPNDYKESTNYDIKCLTSNCTTNIKIKDIRISPYNDIIKKSDIYAKDIDEKDTTKLNNYHYVSFTSMINNKLNTTIQSFDLLRSKLNFKLNNVNLYRYSNSAIENETINIPSEFIDISFSDYLDELHQESFKYKKIQRKLYLQELPYYVTTYNIPCFVNDLHTTLFKEKVFPWLDKKYAKRLERLFFLYCIAPLEKEKEVVPAAAVDNGTKELNYLFTLLHISSSMHLHITGNLVDSDKSKLDEYLLYNDNQFYELCETIFKNNLNIKNIIFCKHSLLNNNLDDLVNNLVFSYQFYRVYYKYIDYRTTLFNVLNNMREMYSYIPYDTNSFLKFYYFEIPKYIIKIITCIETSLICIKLITECSKPE
jgi:hypothetical protein